nr:hypothetical protein CFP56_39112 [Quercus suber]
MRTKTNGQLHKHPKISSFLLYFAANSSQNLHAAMYIFAYNAVVYLTCFIHLNLPLFQSSCIQVKLA